MAGKPTFIAATATAPTCSRSPATPWWEAIGSSPQFRRSHAGAFEGQVREAFSCAAPTEVVNTVAAYDIVYWLVDAHQARRQAEGEAVRDVIEDTRI